MTQEQFDQARTMVDSEDLALAARNGALDELGYLAAANGDEIPDDELAALTRNIVTKHQAAAAPSTIIDKPEPVSTIIDAPVETPAAAPLEPLSQAMIPLGPVTSVLVEADVSNAFITFDMAGFPMVRLTIQAAVEALNGLAMAVDALLTPGPGYHWEDVGLGGAVLHVDWDGDETSKSMAADIHRDDQGSYIVTLHVGTNDPAGSVVAGGADLDSAKYLAAQAVREVNRANEAGVAPQLSPSPETLTPDLPPAA